LIKQPPQDTTFVSIANYVKSVSNNETFPKDYTTPVMLADVLEKDANEALDLVKDIPLDDADLMYEVADIKIWSYMMMYLAEIIKAGIAMETLRQEGDAEKHQWAIKHLEEGLTYWDNIIDIPRPIYNDNLSVHYIDHAGKIRKENNL